MLLQRASDGVLQEDRREALADLRDLLSHKTQASTRRSRGLVSKVRQHGLVLAGSASCRLTRLARSLCCDQGGQRGPGHVACGTRMLTAHNRSSSQRLKRLRQGTCQLCMHRATAVAMS